MMTTSHNRSVLEHLLRTVSFVPHRDYEGTCGGEECEMRRVKRGKKDTAKSYAARQADAMVHEQVVCASDDEGALLEPQFGVQMRVHCEQTRAS